MSQTRWRRINELFHEALAEDPSQRDALIAERAGDDAELAREVRSLLATHERTGHFLDAPAWSVAGDLLADDEPSTLAGRQIGNYRIVEEIGRGGMGVVYAAEDLRLRRMVALKALPPEYTRDRRRRERLQREAQAAAQLSHENIATVHALEEIDGDLYIVSELVRGRTLREELADGPLPPDRLLDTLLDVAAALSLAHARGIVHRDLKPENLLRREDGRIKVLDFGLARFLSPSDATFTKVTEQGLVPGTPGYLAPEQVTGGAADHRSDLFVFGVVAWELATGRHPFGATRSSQIARLVELSEGKLGPLRGDLSLAGLEAIVRRCMRRQPDERYQSADALLEDLRRLRDGAHASWEPSTGVWWWRFHQAGVAVLDALMPVLAWILRRWIGGRAGPAIFFIVLALATTAVTLRLNLVFTSRVHPDLLAGHHARLFPWIARAELALAALLVVAALVVAADHEATAAVIIGIAVVTVASVLVIEPATAGGAGIHGAR